jgi:hypothetical protein
MTNTQVSWSATYAHYVRGRNLRLYIFLYQVIYNTLEIEGVPRDEPLFLASGLSWNRLKVRHISPLNTIAQNGSTSL